MLRTDARGPGPRPSRSSSRFGVALVALGVVLAVAFLFFWRREGRLDVSTVASGRPARTGGNDGRTRAERAPRASSDARREPVRRPRPHPSAETSDERAPTRRAEDTSDPALKAVLAARDDPSADATRVLIDNLTSTDAVVVAEATRALVARHATEAIAPLVAIRLEKAAGSGLSVIDALGKLGGEAEDDAQRAAVDRLLEMLREEKRRHAVESPGNLLQIYEALGDTRDPRAAPALEAELLDAEVPRAPKVVIVHALVDIGLASSKDAIGAARTAQAAQRGDDAFDEEIRKELVAALDAALGSL